MNATIQRARAERAGRHLEGERSVSEISSEISDEMVTAYRDAWAALPVPSTPAERVRAGLAAALAVSGCQPEPDDRETDRG